MMLFNLFIGACRRFAAGPLTAVLLALLCSTPAYALKEVPVRESDTVVVPVSLRDQTRIKVQRGRILDVLGDVYDAQRNPTGRVTVIQDEDGEVYLKPIVHAQGMGLASNAASGGPLTPIKLDFKSTQGAFALLLQPLDAPGQTLEIRVQGGPPPAPAPGSAPKSGSHERAIKALTLAMANPALASEAGLTQTVVRDQGREVALWREARFVLKSQHHAGSMVGEVYELTNISAARMVIDERELFTEGVLSVALRNLILEAGQSTPVWIIKQGRGE